MRIISGTWRSRPLIAPKGDTTRPTADRTRETLFSMLTSRLGSFEGLQVLDLFSGSGALGLEALSRGAAGLGKSVGWHAVGVTGARLAELLPRVASCAAARVDVCVVAAGVNDTTGLTSPRGYARDVRRLVEGVRARFGAAA